MDEPESDDEDEVTGVERDDERSGTKYNVSPFRLALGTNNRSLTVDALI